MDRDLLRVRRVSGLAPASVPKQHDDGRAGRRVSAGLLPTWLAAIMALTLVLAACQSATDGITSSRADRPAADALPRDQGSLPIVRRVEPAQLAAFAILRGPPEGLPPAARSALGTPSFGMSWALAQLVSETLPGSYWVVPANGYLCAVWQVDDLDIASLACTPSATATKSGIAAVSITDPRARHHRRLIVGVAPDGAKQVQIYTARDVRTRPVDHIGAFQLRDTVLAPPDRITPS